MPNESNKIVQVMSTGLDKALSVQRPLVVAHVNRIRRTRKDAAPAEIIRALERHYLGTVTTMGGVSGGASTIAPGAGLALAVGEMPLFFETTALFVLAVAEVHGLQITDLERRRALVLAVIVGNSASGQMERVTERVGKHWGKQIVNGLPIETIHVINKVLGRNFVTKYGTKQGIVVLGRVVPFGIGAGIGAGGNHLIGRSSVKASRAAFGEAPRDWPAITPAPDDNIIDVEAIEDEPNAA